MKRKSVRGLISNARITTIAVFGWILAQLLTIGIAVILTKFVPKVGNLSRIILIIAIGGFSLVIGSLLSVLLTNRSSQVTQNINRSINKVAAGDYSVLVPKIGDNGDIDRLIDNFNKMVKELNSVAVLRKDFITTFSHEFKTPIVSIKGYAELLRESENLTDEQREYLTVIIDESKHLSTLAERTMLLSKLDSGSVSEANEEFYLDEQLGRCAILLDSQMTAKKINLSFSAEHVKITGKHKADLPKKGRFGNGDDCRQRHRYGRRNAFTHVRKFLPIQNGRQKRRSRLRSCDNEKDNRPLGRHNPLRLHDRQRHVLYRHPPFKGRKRIKN